MRLEIGISALIAVLAPSAAAAAATTYRPSDAESVVTSPVDPRALGAEEAPHQIVVYISMICSNCSPWYLNVLPRLKTDFVDTGRARIVFRDLTAVPLAYSAPAAGLATCAAPDRYFEVVDSLMRGEKAVREGASVTGWQDEAIAVSGRTRDEMVACVSDPTTLAKVQSDVEEAQSHGLRNVPGAIVDGIPVPVPTYDNIAAVINSDREFETTPPASAGAAP